MRGEGLSYSTQVCRSPRSPVLVSGRTFHRSDAQRAGPGAVVRTQPRCCTNEQRDADLHADVEGRALLPAPPPILFRGHHPEPARSPRCTFGSGTKTASALSGGVPLSAGARGADSAVGQSLPFVGSPPLLSPLAAGSLRRSPEPQTTRRRSPHPPSHPRQPGPRAARSN